MAYRALRGLRMTWPSAEQFAGEADVAATVHSDRGAAIVAVNFLDFGLQLAIAQRLSGVRSPAVDALFEEFGPLHTFDAKIHMGLALNMYGDQTKQFLIAVKHIRNAFAHAPRRIGFHTGEIKAACASLVPPPEILGLFDKRKRSARARFLGLTSIAGLVLMGQSNQFGSGDHRGLYTIPELHLRKPLP